MSACICGKPHKQFVSYFDEDAGVRRWFCSMACRFSYVHAEPTERFQMATREAVMNGAKILSLILMFVVFWRPANAIEVDISAMTGETITVVTAICATQGEASALLGHVKAGGKPAAIAYMRRPDNSCDVAMVRVIIGEVAEEAIADGLSWVVLNVTSEDSQMRAFLVIPRMVKPPGTET